MSDILADLKSRLAYDAAHSEPDDMIKRAADEIAWLRRTAIIFYAKQPDLRRAARQGGLPAHDYDDLSRCGANMADFTRDAI